MESQDPVRIALLDRFVRSNGEVLHVGGLSEDLKKRVDTLLPHLAALVSEGVILGGDEGLYALPIKQDGSLFKPLRGRAFRS